MNAAPASDLTVLVIGSGGREHALVRALAADPAVGAVHTAPGNPGTALLGSNHQLDPLDAEQVLDLATRIAADLVVIGPEAPLVAGVADLLVDNDIPVFGPTAAAAQLEGSKSFAKEVMAAAGVPTAGFRVCTTPAQVDAALAHCGPPYVVKNDGLAAGKGVVVTDDIELARAHAAACGRVVIEEYLDGPEVSLFVITDGHTAVPLHPAQDFKRVGDGNAGPNTGGMGAYSPLPWLPPGVIEEVMRCVVAPTLTEMDVRGNPFTGLLYVGLAITSRGPRVVEFNARFGDPETEAVLPLLETGLGGLLHAAATGRLAQHEPLRWRPGAGVCVVLAADGYPGSHAHGGRITLPPDTPEAHVIQAGTGLDAEGGLIATGGRVLVVVGTGTDIEAARRAAYRHIEDIDFAEGFHRSDIAAAGRLPLPGTLMAGRRDREGQR